MSKLSIHVVPAIIALLTGCVSAPPLKQAPVTPPTSGGSFISGAMPTSAQKYAYTDLEGTYFGASGASGSLAAGLLLGPIGVAANIAHINSKNRERATPLTALTSQNLATLLSHELPMLGRGVPSTYKITPAANVYFTSDTAYWLTCTVTAELPDATGAPTWSARYAIPVEGTFDSARSDDTVKASASLGLCLHSAYDLFEEHIGGKLGAFQTRTVTSRTPDGSGTVDLQHQVAVSRLPAKVLVNDFRGITELRAAEVVQVKQ